LTVQLTLKAEQAANGLVDYARLSALLKNRSRK
jgi:hypothetical protein